MNVFEWDQNFETGIPEVDQQHHHLVDVINDFGLILSRNEVNSLAIEKVYGELLSYAQYHFDEEEELMARIGVDSQHIGQQEAEHRVFLQEVTTMRQQMLLAASYSGTDLFEFLINWFVFHVMGFDMSMARQIQAIQRGQSGVAAYQAEGRGVDKATGLLLQSVKNLLRQVSNRNKQLSELNRTLEARVEERTQALSEANQRLGEQALTDSLTGLSNRRHAMQILERLWAEAMQTGGALACMMIDADGFKEINDTHGHAAGDIVLRELAKHLKYAVRTDDIVCRLGGDEFLIILPKTDREGSIQVANHAHARISVLSVAVAGGVWQGSISVGVATKSAAMQQPEDLIKVADRGVYAAKAAGKNCVKIVD